MNFFYKMYWKNAAIELKYIQSIKYNSTLEDAVKVFQGAAAFKLFTGKDMPIDYMKDILDIHYETGGNYDSCKN